MKERELRRLSKTELLEMLIDLRQQCDALEKDLQKTREWLKDKELNIQKAGSIAQASLQLSGVFQAAEEAATQYVNNIERLTRERAEQMLRETEAKCREKERTYNPSGARLERHLVQLCREFPGLQERLIQLERGGA